MEQVNVALRVRPLLPAEKERGEEEKVSVRPDGTQVQVISRINCAAQNNVYNFDMDYCLGPKLSQEDVFRTLDIAGMCDAVFEGKAATVMCFGQTGSGKTYTMSGRVEAEETLHITDEGIQYAAVRYISAARDRLFSSDSDMPTTKITLRASYLELYSERINDLLSGAEGLKCHWSRDANCFFVENLMVVECLTVEDFLLVLQEGQMRRKRSEHLLNADSSRSHVLFTVYAEVTKRDRPALHGKITFVDLAGSERLRDTGSQGDDSKSINRSLFALGNVVEKLSRGRETHIPYRSSLLTQLLMDSLGGGCRTLLVACVTPSSRFVEESLRTIHFAQRTRNIRSRPVERVDATQQEMYNLKMEIRRLQAENVTLRRALNLPESGPFELNVQKSDNHAPPLPPPPPLRQQQQQQQQSASASSIVTETRAPQLTSSFGRDSCGFGNCGSGNLRQHPTPMDILIGLPNSSDLAAQKRLLPPNGGGFTQSPSTSSSLQQEQKNVFGFHVVSKKNKHIYRR